VPFSWLASFWPAKRSNSPAGETNVKKINEVIVRLDSRFHGNDISWCLLFYWITSLAPLTAHPCATSPADAGMTK